MIHPSASRMRHWVTFLVALCLCSGGRVFGRQAPAQQSGHPTPGQVKEAWQALRQAMVATRNSDNRAQITEEEAERRFAAHAETAHLLIQSYDEPASGKVLPPGGTITGDALIGGYFPNLARAYCSWMAAERTKDPNRKYAYYSAVHESLWHGVAEADGAREPKRQSRQLSAVYDTPFVRRMAIAAALSRRRIALEQARAAGEADAAGLSVASEMLDLQRLRKLPPAAFERMDQRADVEDIVGKAGYLEILGKSVQAVLDAELARSKPAFRLVTERADWQAEGRTKVIAGSIESLTPVTVRVVDAASGQPLPNAVQNHVIGPFDIRVDLEEKPEPSTVKLVLDDPLTKESITFATPIVLWNIPQPTIAVASRTRNVSDIFVTDLSFAVQRARPGDIVKVEAVEAAGTKSVHEETIAAAGDRTVSVPRFRVQPNAETPLRITITRGKSVLPSEEIRIVSQTTPTVSGRILSVNDLVSLVEIEVRDYADKVTGLSLNGIPFPPSVVPVQVDPVGPETPARFVFLVPWTGVGEGVTIGARTVREAQDVTVPWPAAPTAIAKDDPRLDKITDYQRELAKGDLDAGQRAYLAVLTDPQHAREASVILSDLYDYRLKRAPEGVGDDTITYLNNLRILAKAVQRADDLDSRIGQVQAQIEAEQERRRRAEAERAAREAAQRAKEQKEREEAERKAREAQKAREAAEEAARKQKTPVELKVVRSAYSAQDGLLWMRLAVSGLVLGRTVHSIRLDDIEMGAPLDAFVTPGGDAAPESATVECITVPPAASGSIRVTAVVSYPGAGQVPISASVDLKPGALDQVSEKLQGYAAYLRTGKHDGAPLPQWLRTMAIRRAGQLAAAAKSSVAAMQKDKRAADAVTTAHQAVARAVEYAEAVKASTGSETPDAAAAKAALTALIAPKLSVEGVSLVKKPQGFILSEGAAVRVRSWADDVIVKAGDRTLKGARSGGEWRFSLAGFPGKQGTLKVVAEVTGPEGTTARDEQDIQLELPAASVAFNLVRPDFVYCDDGTGKRSLVYSANATGRNDDILIEYDSPQAKLMAWTVLDSKGNKVEGSERAPLAPPLDGISIPAGKLKLGKYTVRVQLWDSTDATQTPSVQDVAVRVAPRAVAFIVGINYYPALSAMPSLAHAADDAMSLRAKLIEKGYAPENIIYVVGRNDTGTPEVKTNGLQNPKSDTPNDLSETRRTGQLNGIVRKKYVDTAFESFLNVLRLRKAVHALVYFAGHGTNVPAALQGTSGALNADHLIMADDEKTAPAKIYVYSWPQRIKASVTWGSKENPATVMCIYDACRNGTAAVFDALPPQLRSDDGAVVASALFSCQKGEQANENMTSDPKLAVAYKNEVFQNGFFTYALLKGLDELPESGPRLPDVIEKAGSVLATLVQQTPEKNRLASGASKPYSERQSLRPRDDLKRWEDAIYVIYPVQRSDVGLRLRGVLTSPYEGPALSAGRRVFASLFDQAHSGRSSAFGPAGNTPTSGLR